MDSHATLRVVRLRERARLPERASAGSSGFDVHACLDGPLVLGRSPQRVPTGLAVEVEPGFDVQVRPRSGLSARGVAVAFGTVDADYRGEVFVTMWTFGDLDRHELRDGDRIAQFVVGRLPEVSLEEAEELSPTARGEGGHGSTGR
jgi:dUTP pyrophosphatase